MTLYSRIADAFSCWHFVQQLLVLGGLELLRVLVLYIIDAECKSLSRWQSHDVCILNDIFLRHFCTFVFVCACWRFGTATEIPATYTCLVWWCLRSCSSRMLPCACCWIRRVNWRAHVGPIENSRTCGEWRMAETVLRMLLALKWGAKSRGMQKLMPACKAKFLSILPRPLLHGAAVLSEGVSSVRHEFF